jgi:hypothetical protein
MVRIAVRFSVRIAVRPTAVVRITSRPLRLSLNYVEEICTRSRVTGA